MRTEKTSEAGRRAPQLKLHRETLWQLSESDLQKVAGGLTRHTNLVESDCRCI